MDQLQDWGASLSSAFAQFADTLIAIVPRLLGALLLLLIGWLLARLLRGLTSRLIQTLDRAFLRLSGAGTDEYQRLKRSADSLVSTVVFWLVLLLFFGAAANVLGIGVFSRWVGAVLLYLPTLAAGIAIILAGFIFGDLVRRAVTRTAHTATLQHAEALGRVTQVAVVGTAIVVGASQLGVDVTFLVNIATVAVGAVLGGLALGVALSTPAHISNLISARHLRRTYREGDVIAIGAYRGRIVSMTERAVILETTDGDVSIPAKLFAEEPCTRLATEKSGGEG